MPKAQAAPRADSAAEPWFEWTSPAPRRRAATRPSPRRDRGGERRRRADHFRRRRRDLLVDAMLALVLAIILISITAGLGILLLLVVPMAGVLIAQPLVARRRARRSAHGPARGGSQRRRARSARG